MHKPVFQAEKRKYQVNPWKAGEAKSAFSHTREQMLTAPLRPIVRLYFHPGEPAPQVLLDAFLA